MILMQPYIPAVFAGIVYLIWVGCARPLTGKKIISRLLFVFGGFCLFVYYGIPLPLDKVGFLAVGDSQLSLSNAIRLLPFRSMIESRRHLPYYFGNMKLLCASALLFGLSWEAALEKELTRKRYFLIVLTIPGGCFALLALIRLLSGTSLKIADTTEIIIFAFVFLIGRLVFDLIKNNKSP